MEAALLLPPYYFSKVTDAGLERWLRLILEDSRMPIYLCASTPASLGLSLTCTSGLTGPCTAPCGHAVPIAMYCMAQDIPTSANLSQKGGIIHADTTSQTTLAILSQQTCSSASRTTSPC